MTYEDFKGFSGFERDFEIDLGIERLSDVGMKRFSELVKSDLEGILNVSFRVVDFRGGGPFKRHFHFMDHRSSVGLVVDAPRDPWPYSVLPASLTVKSNEVPAWEVAAGIYLRMESLGKYLLLATLEGGGFISSNFASRENI
ncbi:hypothetical protein ABT115_26565 [Streptomyces sp. NPDC001832]|uniref:hypothetical protein n=1 Tax=Streptomyces sp. NPDC001832 TaxID=3154527 RepID=UPI00332F14EA